MASLCSPLDPVDDYCITLDKSVYFPGETVSGKLALVTNSKIECRGVHVELIGRGSARIFPNNEARPCLLELKQHAHQAMSVK